MPESSAFFAKTEKQGQRRWAVVLAGGSGTRLQPLTRRLFGNGIPGEGCPKQFCTLFGGKTLLDHTQARIAPVVHAEFTTYLVVRAHSPYYQTQLGAVPQERILVQPANRGTTAGIAFALARIAALDPDAILGFFPADHYFADEDAFVGALDRAYGFAAQRRDSILLLGAAPEHAEPEYGWIEPASALEVGGSQRAGASKHAGLSRVRRFWEKPSAEVARGLMESGCLWNTFVMLGSVRSFLSALKESVPAVLRAFEPLLWCAPKRAAEFTAQAYSGLASGDFSKQVLSAVPERLAVMRLENTGWSDLGTPERLMATWSRYGLSPTAAAEHATAAC